MSENSFNHGQSGNNGGGNNGNWTVPKPMTVLPDGTIVNPGGNAPPGLNKKVKPPPPEPEEPEDDDPDHPDLRFLLDTHPKRLMFKMNTYLFGL